MALRTGARAAARATQGTLFGGAKQGTLFPVPLDAGRRTSFPHATRATPSSGEQLNIFDNIPPKTPRPVQLPIPGMDPMPPKVGTATRHSPGVPGSKTKTVDGRSLWERAKGMRTSHKVMLGGGAVLGLGVMNHSSGRRGAPPAHSSGGQMGPGMNRF